jgi:hypothetical protein
MKVIRDSDGNLINIGEWTAEAPLPEGAYEDEADIVEDNGLWERATWLKRTATRRLQGTDHVHAKARERGLTLHPDWIAWRETLRGTSAGVGSEVPAEPQRFMEFAQPVTEEEQEEEIPPDIAALMRENAAFSDAAVLLAKYNELTNKILMSLANDADRAMHTRLHNNLHWLERKAAEII